MACPKENLYNIYKETAKGVATLTKEDFYDVIDTGFNRNALELLRMQHSFVEPLDPRAVMVSGYKKQDHLCTGRHADFYDQGEFFIKRIVADTPKAEQYVREVLVGQILAARRPDLFHAYHYINVSRQRIVLVSRKFGEDLLEWSNHPHAREKDHKARYTEFVNRFVEFSAKALMCMHDMGLIHGDFKPENVLCDGKGFRLIDFEFATFVGSLSKNRLASPRYCNIHALNYPVRLPVQDICALYVTMLKLATCGSVSCELDSQLDRLNARNRPKEMQRYILHLCRGTRPSIVRMYGIPVLFMIEDSITLVDPLDNNVEDKFRSHYQ